MTFEAALQRLFEAALRRLFEAALRRCLLILTLRAVKKFGRDSPRCAHNYYPALLDDSRDSYTAQLLALLFSLYTSSCFSLPQEAFVEISTSITWNT